MITEPQPLTLTEAAVYTGASPKAVRKATRDGALIPHPWSEKLRMYLYTIEELDKWSQGLRTEPVSRE